MQNDLSYVLHLHKWFRKEIDIQSAEASKAPAAPPLELRNPRIVEALGMSAGQSAKVNKAPLLGILESWRPCAPLRT